MTPLCHGELPQRLNSIPPLPSWDERQFHVSREVALVSEETKGNRRTIRGLGWTSLGVETPAFCRRFVVARLPHGWIQWTTPTTLGIGKESVTSKPTKTFPYVPPAA
jgi:hypothetical protein